MTNHAARTDAQTAANTATKAAASSLLGRFALFGTRRGQAEEEHFDADAVEDRDLIQLHAKLNIAAIKGEAGAAERRSEIAATMTKLELAAALRLAREWKGERRH